MKIKIDPEKFKNKSDAQIALEIVELMQISKHNKIKISTEPEKKKLLQNDINLLQSVIINLQTHLFNK